MNTYYLYIYLFYEVVYPMLSAIMCVGANISYRSDGAIPFKYLNTVVEVHSSTLRSTGSRFFFPEMRWAYMTTSLVLR